MAVEAVEDALAWEGKRWELRAAMRAARRARAEASRSGRRDPALQLVEAAQELGMEGDGRFTVKQVTERAGVALQTFYRHFGSKDDLLLAVIEENIARGSVDIAAAAAHERDPVEHLRVVVETPILMSTSVEAHQRLRFHARERQRLSELYPAEVEAAFAPYLDLVTDAVRRAAVSEGRDVSTAARDADVVMHVVIFYAHGVGSGAVPWTVDDVADHVWNFCRAALIRHPGSDRLDPA